MRVVLLVAGLGPLVLVPAGIVLMLFSDKAAWVPVWFWLVWLLISLGVALEGPVLADALAPPSRGIHGMNLDAWIVALGVLNVVSALDALVFLALNKPTG